MHHTLIRVRTISENGLISLVDCTAWLLMLMNWGPESSCAEWEKWTNGVPILRPPSFFEHTIVFEGVHLRPGQMHMMRFVNCWSDASTAALEAPLPSLSP